MSVPQNYKNHARWDPLFHYFVAPVLLINVIVTLVVLIAARRYHPLLHLWIFIMAVALFALAAVARSSALRAQDRVIRLEEKLRYAVLLAPEQLELAQALTLRQIIALRFASDAELPALVVRAVREGLAPKAIKEAIVAWRADDCRV